MSLGVCDCALVLTAQHCLGIPSEQFTLAKTGVENRPNFHPGTAYRVLGTFAPSEANAARPLNDVGVVVLSEAIYSEPARLTATRPALGATLRVVGYGDDERAGSESRVPRSRTRYDW